MSIYQIDQDIINRIVEKAKENEKKRHDNQVLIVEKNDIEEAIKDLDEDHPIEEREKAEKQLKNLSAKVQLDAPVAQNLISPGIWF